MPCMSLAEHYRNTRQASEILCQPLAEEDYLPQLVEYASPPKWHLAHTSWFFEELILKKQLEGYQEFDSRFCFLFNSYYNTVGERLARNARGDISRPSTATVYKYRQHVDAHMQRLLSGPLPSDLKALITLGINHEQQHQELLLSDLKYAFGHNPIFPVYREDGSLLDDRNSNEGLIQLEEGLYEVGFQGEGFHFDNEKQAHKVYLQAFEIDRALVSNAEYLAFIKDGGYENFSYWLDDGWHWLQQSSIRAPLYWHLINGEWHYYTLAGLKKLEPDAILCHVSFYEASAFANWKGMRLPTEFEWEVASEQIPWGLRWEWTNSAYLPYPGYQVSAGAVGEYNGKFMINQMVLRGASVATPAGHSRKTYRNFFHPHLQWQFSGIRLAK